MSTYDHYESVPQLKCPRCDALLSNWQGDFGPNKFFFWRQHNAQPIEQQVNADVQLPATERAKYRLPDKFVISALCSCGMVNEADCDSENDCWTTTRLVTGETIMRRQNEGEDDFIARRRTLLNNLSVQSYKYPAQWLERVPAIVFGSLIPGEIRIIIHPGVGLADGGSPHDISTEIIPLELRMPNTLLWIQLDKQLKVARVWKRSEEVEP